MPWAGSLDAETLDVEIRLDFRLLPAGDVFRSVSRSYCDHGHAARCAKLSGGSVGSWSAHGGACSYAESAHQRVAVRTGLVCAEDTRLIAARHSTEPKLPAITFPCQRCHEESKWKKQSYSHMGW